MDDMVNAAVHVAPQRVTGKNQHRRRNALKNGRCAHDSIAPKPLK
jgi:hypothetical protein